MDFHIPSGAQFCAARHLLGMKQSEVGKEFGASQNVIWKIENDSGAVMQRTLMNITLGYERKGIVFMKAVNGEGVWLNK